MDWRLADLPRSGLGREDVVFDECRREGMRRKERKKRRGRRGEEGRKGEAGLLFGCYDG